MEKVKINYFIDFFAGISFFINAITGFILLFFLPSEVRQGRYQIFLGLVKDKWLKIHAITGVILVILILIHLILHWTWIVSMTKRFFKKKKINH
jgi:hypothetical protein